MYVSVCIYVYSVLAFAALCSHLTKSVIEKDLVFRTQVCFPFWQYFMEFMHLFSLLVTIFRLLSLFVFSLPSLPNLYLFATLSWVLILMFVIFYFYLLT